MDLEPIETIGSESRSPLDEAQGFEKKAKQWIIPKYSIQFALNGKRRGSNVAKPASSPLKLGTGTRFENDDVVAIEITQVTDDLKTLRD